MQSLEDWIQYYQLNEYSVMIIEFQTCSISQGRVQVRVLEHLFYQVLSSFIRDLSCHVKCFFSCLLSLNSCLVSFYVCVNISCQSVVCVKYHFIINCRLYWSLSRVTDRFVWFLSCILTLFIIVIFIFFLFWFVVVWILSSPFGFVLNPQTKSA